MAPYTAMQCEVCEYVTDIVSEKPEVLLQQLQIHVQLQHPNGAAGLQPPATAPTARGKVGECAQWPEECSFEEWKMSLDIWKQTAVESGMGELSGLSRLVESLKVSPNKEVRN